MRLCVNGHWLNDVCRCLEYWQGESCDKRDCGQYGILNETNGFCQCANNYDGEFCQYNVCFHRQQWYCNETRAVVGDGWSKERRPCPLDVLSDRFSQSLNVSSDLYCVCGLGTSTRTASSTCLCQPGYYGEFCQWSLCPTGERWNENGSCEAYSFHGNGTNKITTLGFFGYDINVEFAVTAIILLSVVFVFLVFGRLIVEIRKRRQKGQTDIRKIKTKRKNTIDHYYDLFHRRRRSNGREKATTDENKERKMAVWERVFNKSAIDKVRVWSMDGSDRHDRKITTASVGPVLEHSDSITVTATVPPRGRSRSITTTTFERPRSGSTQLETVFEGKEMREKNEEDIADEVQDEKYRESMLNFARQISSDMESGESSDA